MSNNTSQQPIAILGGMGPDASARLYQRMIEMARKEFGVRNNEEYPEIILQSIPVPDFISDTTRAEKAVFMLRNRVRQLSKLPLSCMALACNTAHTTLVDLETETKTPFVSIPEEIAKVSVGKRYSRVGLLASPMTIYSGVYQSVFQSNGINTVLPSLEEIEELGEIIEAVVGGEFKSGKKRLLTISDSLKKKKIDALVLGCTELPLIFPKNHSLPVLDSIDILARSLLKRYYQKGD